MEWSRIVGAAVFLGVGAFGGYRLAGGATPADDHGHAHHAPKLSDHEVELLEKQREDEGTVHLDKAAMVRLGVQLSDVRIVPEFVSTMPLHAVVEAVPAGDRTIHAPIGGRVQAVHVETGQAVGGGEAVITLQRERLPRPALTVTASLLTQGQAAEAPSEGDGPGLDSSSLRAALSQSGLWTETATSLLASLPADVQDTPWSVATIGELVATGLADGRVAAWFEEEASAADHFLEIGVLLLRGHALPEVKEMHSAGAFNAVVEVRVPATENADALDVHALYVHPGASVESGDPLLCVRDYRRMSLRIGAVGGEVERLLNAASTGLALRATPLLAGSGPDLDGVMIRQIKEEGTGYAVVKNAVASPTGIPEAAPRFRTWGLREGMRYLVHLPDARFEDVIVLPRAAVVRSGAERVVFVSRNGHLEPRPIRVAFEDADSCVIQPDASIELGPGDRVVTGGAFEVSLAASAGSGDAVDPHAGHSH